MSFFMRRKDGMRGFMSLQLIEDLSDCLNETALGHCDETRIYLRGILPVSDVFEYIRRYFYEIYMRQAPDYARIYVWLAVFGPMFTRPAYLSAKQQSVRRRNCDVRGMCSRLRFAVLFWRPAMQRKDHSMPSFLLDLMYVAIGVAAFAITAFYLGACGNL
jgi:hypothetical protein